MRIIKSIGLVCLIVSFAALNGCGRAEEAADPRVQVSAETAPVAEPAPITATMPVVKPADAVSDAKGPAITHPVVKEVPPIIDRAEGAGPGEGVILVADFEGWPNNLGGEPGVYGSLVPDWDTASTEPYSWVYGPDVAGYDAVNVHGGTQSFRLVNGLGLNPGLEWGSFSMDLGPTTDTTVVPKKVESLDASPYRYLSFWVKGERGGEKMQLLLRDAHAVNYMPQATYDVPPASGEWRKVLVPLAAFGGRVDVTQLDNIGLAFGANTGNMKGDMIYLDDFVFTNKN